ncbi:MAG TPA: hypothetical protein VIK01_15740, partial [Polyangiaceae bacterium]
MSLSNIDHRSTLRPALLTSLLGAALFTACGASPPGLSVGEVAGTAGNVSPSQGGADDVPAAGSPQTADGGDAQGGADVGNASGGDATAGNATGGSTESGGGAGTLSEAGEPGQGSGGAGDVKIAAVCPFHTDAVVASGGEGASAGAGGGAGAGAGAGGSGGAG